MLGGERLLSTADLDRLRSVSGSAYARELPPDPCATAPEGPEAEDAVRDIVREMLNIVPRGK
jgi:hypothetical protein